MADGSGGSVSNPVDAETIDSCGCKVGRVIDRYELPAFHERLATRWIGANGDRSSLRELERYFNEAVLRTAMEDAGLDPLAGEVAHIYRHIVDDGTGGRAQVRARRRLERAGIDAEALTADFVSHATVGNHLKRCLGVSPPERGGGDPIERARDRVYKLQNRAEAVVEGSLEHLRDTGRLDAEDVDVFVTASVVCERCGSQYDVGEYIRDGGCGCRRDPDPS